MDEGVQTAPFLSDTFEYGLQLAGRVDVERHENRRVELLGERFDVFPGLVVDVGDRHIGAERTECFGASPGDGVLVRYTDDQALLSIQQFRLCRRYHGPRRFILHFHIHSRTFGYQRDITLLFPFPPRLGRSTSRGYAARSSIPHWSRSPAL